MSNNKITYTYVNKRKQDIVMYTYIIAALVIALAVVAKLFPALVAPEARNMLTAIYIVGSALLALVLILPFMNLKKKHNWFINQGTAELGHEAITFTPGVRIAYKDIYRILCDNTADFGRPTQRLRIAYNTTAFQLILEQHRSDEEATPFVQIARALGEKCSHLVSADYNSDIEFVMPKPEPAEDEIIYRKR